MLRFASSFAASRRPRISLVLFGCLSMFGPACRDKSVPLTAVASSGALAPPIGNTALDVEITTLQAGIRTQLEKAQTVDVESWNKLARAFVRKARQANDPRFYQQADDAALRALQIDPESNGALQIRQAVLLSDHRFREAQHLAGEQIKKHPRDQIAWGALGDAAVELGDYDTAMTAYQAMIDIKPDLRSYNRGAWMRWLSGDSDGAVELMKMAVDVASGRESESRAWCRVQLGDLYFYRGQYELARATYDLALRELPGYAPAFVSRGRLLVTSDGGLADGLADLAAALKIQPTVVARALYIDALEQANQKDEAQKELAVLLHEGPRDDPRSLALFLASHKEQLELALRLAQEEVDRRPDIWSYDALAWAEYRSEKLDLAFAAAEKANRLKTPDPRLRFHLGAIALARGDRSRAISELRTALAESPRWDLRESAEARALLVKLGETPP